MLVTPVKAPKANAYAERWVQTVRAECLDWLLIVGRGRLEQVLRVYVGHYNAHRPHRALALQPQRPVRDWLSSATISRPESTDAICSAVSCTTTGELHEHTFAYPTGGVVCDVPARPRRLPVSGFTDAQLPSPGGDFADASHKTYFPVGMKRRLPGQPAHRPFPAILPSSNGKGPTRNGSSQADASQVVRSSWSTSLSTGIGSCRDIGPASPETGEGAMERLHRRMRIEVVLAVISAALCVLTLVFPEWIEELTGLEPDAGSGALEWIISGVFLVSAVVSAVLARRDYRRLAEEHS
jgi:hypothetical protein